MVTLDAVFDLFSKERRRYVLYYLDQQEGSISIEELIEQVADWETEASHEDIPGGKYDQIELSLRHTHLPKTAEVDFIEYHPDKGTINVRGSPTEFDAIVTIAKIIEQPDKSD
jgi:hypothetical protein